jgi:DNA polymerase-3 subunit gamma/tau
MAHQVLARKWRPRDFESLVGQDHVVRALTHALSTQRLHHAYLFTGTRGVGKTTIARILAKSLNCETGVTAKPCGVCRACTEIDAGRFVDYIEMDAASNRGVEEMTQVLEQAVYAPSAARYKVYVIDEVHMLSSHAFNAMLKTLEEPPGHVVFVLATTDPQRVPVTVLSRCLQFNLKNMPPVSVAGHLARVLEAEAIRFEASALPLIGRAAAGSMRDALSLLDQAIAFGAGEVTEAQVREMLGVVDGRYLSRVLDALIAADAAALVGVADDMLAANAPFDRTLRELSGLLQRIALAQVGAFGDVPDAELLRGYAEQIAAEDLQVFYQIAIHGAQDMALALDAHTGFTMTLLRLLAFRAGAGGASGSGEVATRSEPGRAAPVRLPVHTESTLTRPQAVLPVRPSAAPRVPAPAGMPTSPAQPRGASDRADPGARRPVPGVANPTGTVPSGGARSFDGDWTALAGRLGLSGFALQFMQQSELLEFRDNAFRVRVPIKALAEPPTMNKVRDALSDWFGQPMRVSAEVGGVSGATAASVASRLQAERIEQAEASLASDPFVQTLINEFGGRIVPDSIRPAGPD